MNANELLEEWTSGESSGMDAKRIQQNAGDFREYTGYNPPHSLAEIDSWQERMKGQVTRKLRESAGEDVETGPEKAEDDSESEDESEEGQEAKEDDGESSE